MNDQTTPATTTVPSAPERISPAKIIKWTLAALVLVAAIGFGVHYWRLSRLYVSTDNAYLNANRIELAAQVSGPVRALWVRDQQTVEYGELLLQIGHLTLGVGEGRHGPLAGGGDRGGGLSRGLLARLEARALRGQALRLVVRLLLEVGDLVHVLRNLVAEPRHLGCDAPVRIMQRVEIRGAGG